MGNTVGSRAILNLTDRQRAIIIGKILGDGCLEKNGNYTRLKIDQGQKQKNYVFWLYEELSSLVPSKPYKIEVYSRGKRDVHWRFATYSNPAFDSFRLKFYGKRKSVPANINQLLNEPMSLAVWYMDDGYKRTDRSGLYLCTSAFSKKDNHLLQVCLERNFGLSTNIHYAGGYPRIHLPAKYAGKFCQIIKPFVLESLSYKLL